MENKAQSSNHFLAFSKTSTTSPRSSVLQNLTNTFQRSVISTSKSKNDNRNQSANKSRIKALPNYERYSLGNNLPFVTIFQTIQIERLSDQIETQRIKLKEYERHIFNAVNFEVQIKELTEKCTANESELTQYRDQLDKMNKICETLYHENENLKNKLKNTDSMFKTKLQEESKKNKQLAEDVQRWAKKSEISELMRQNQIQQMRSMMEKQRKSMIDREMKDAQGRHQSQTAKLVMEIRRLNQLLAAKDVELIDVKKKHQNSQDYIKQLKQYGSKLNEYEQKICLLSQEHLRLSRIIDVNTSQLDMARKKQFKLAQQIKTDKELLIDNEHLRELIEMKHNEMQMWKQQFSQLEQELSTSRDLQQINFELSAKVTCMNEQNQKLSKLLKERSSQIERWRNNMNQLEQTSDKCRQYQDMLIQQQSKFKVLQVENQRLDGINKIRVREVEDLKNRLMGLQNQSTTLSRLEKEKKNIEQKYKTQVERIMELENYIERSNQEAQSLRQSTIKLQSSQSLIESLRKQNQRLAQKLAESERQMNNLKQFETQLGQQSMKLKENNGIVSQYQNKQMIMTDEINRLSEMLRTKNEQIVRLEDERISNYTMISQYKSLQGANEEKDRIIQKLKADIDEYQSRVLGYEQKMEEIDTKNQEIFANLNQELKNTEQDFRKKAKQCEELRSRQNKIKYQLQEMSQCQKLNQKQQNRIAVYLHDLEDLRNQKKQYERVLSEERRNVSQLQSELKRIKASQQSLSTIRSVAESRNGQSVASSTITGSMYGTGSTVDAGKLVEKVNQLEQMLKDLKIKYGDLLKQVSGGSSGTIKSSTENSMIDMV